MVNTASRWNSFWSIGAALFALPWVAPMAIGAAGLETVTLQSRSSAPTTALFYRPSQAFTEAVLVLPGSGESVADWMPVAQSFAERDMAVLIPGLAPQPHSSETGAPGAAVVSRYDEEDSGFRGSPSALRRTPVYGRFMAAVQWLREASEESSAQTTARGSLDLLTVIAHGEATAMLGPWIAADPDAAQVLVLVNPWPEAGFDLAAPLEAFGGPLLSVWVDGDLTRGRLAEAVFLSRPGTRSLWHLELPGDANDLVRRPEFCEDLPQWSLKAMRKLGGKAFTAANP